VQAPRKYTAAVSTAMIAIFLLSNIIFLLLSNSSHIFISTKFREQAPEKTGICEPKTSIKANIYIK